MKDHEKAQLVNELRDIAREFHATEQLRARIADKVLPALERVERETIHEGGAAVAEVAQRFATESESLRLQVRSLEQAYAQCMARQAQRAAEETASYPSMLEFRLGEAAGVCLKEGHKQAAQAVLDTHNLLRERQRTIDWGAVDADLLRIVGEAREYPVPDRVISDLRTLLRKVSGQ